MARTRPATLTATKPALPAFNPMTASARPILPNRKLVIAYDSAQQAAWEYWKTLPEPYYAVDWLANMASRCRLVIAEVPDSGDEPELIETGPAAELLKMLAGGAGGQPQLIWECVTHLQVPGEGWLVGEAPDSEIPDGPDFERWLVLSADEIRPSKRRKIRGENTFEVREGDGENANNDSYMWRQISPDSLVVRFWRADPRYGWRADSPVVHAAGALLELSLIDKRIVATILSRLASSGVLLYDKGRLSIPGQGPAAEGMEAVDPFAKILVDVASRGISDPASPEALIPIPIGYDITDLENVDPKLLMQVIKFGDTVSPELMAQRISAISRVATAMSIPPEILTGTGAANHWGAALIEESAVRANISPVVELLCNSLTTGYLYPRLKAEGQLLTGPSGGRLVVWYDPSPITVRPDKSKNTVEAYDRFEVSGDALRRETGLGDEDAPNPAELNEMMLKKIVRDVPALAAAAVEQLGGPRLEAAASPSTSVTINRPGKSDVPSDATVPESDVVESPDSQESTAPPTRR